MSEIAAVLKSISQAYGDKTVIHDLSLEIPKGKIVCLLGASGCGKTTTLQLLGGFLQPTKGTITIDGEDMTGIPPERRPVSTVFQSYALFPHMTVLENVIYGLRFQKLSKKEAQAEGLKYLSIVGLEGYENAAIQNISGGQQQRVALARALIVRPKMILMDEPLSNLDAGLRVHIREELRDLQRKLGMTIVFVTHDQEEALTLGDLIAIMRDGKILQCGTPEEVYEHPVDKYTMDFLGKSDCITLDSREKVYVRPEAIDILSREPSNKNAQSSVNSSGSDTGFSGTEKTILTGVITKSEYFGFYRQYVIHRGEEDILVRTGPDEKYPIGSHVSFTCDKEKVLFRDS